MLILFIFCVLLLMITAVLLLALLKARAAGRALQQDSTHLKAAQSALQDFGLTQLVRGNAPRFEQLDAYYTLFDLHFPSNTFMVLTIKIRHHPFGSGNAAQESAAAAVQEELSGILGLYADLRFVDLDGLMVCLYCEPKLRLPENADDSTQADDDMQAQLQKLLVLHCEACAAALQENHGIDVLIAVGHYDRGGFALHNNYLFSKALLEQAVRAKWAGSVVCETDTLTQIQDSAWLDTRRQFYNCFTCFKYEDAAACLFHMVELRMQHYMDSFSEAREVVATQLRFCTDMLELPLNVVLDLPDGGTIQIRDVIQGSEDPESLREHIYQYFSGLALLNGQQHSQAAPFTDRVYQYIQAHYADNQLSVSSISEHFQINVSYLSRQFKQEYGCGVLEFIHKTRIAAARELLAAGVSPNDCFAQVGYSSRRAFDSAFSRYEGITPKAWQLQRESSEKH